VTLNGDQTVTATFTKLTVTPPPSCTLTPDSSKVLLKKPKGSKRKGSLGSLSLTATCDEAASGTLTGKLIVTKGKKRITIDLPVLSVSLHAGTPDVLTVELPGSARSDLRKRLKTSASFTLSVANANGTGTVSTTIARVSGVR
jgi:hypothetical protein